MYNFPTNEDAAKGSREKLTAEPSGRGPEAGELQG
jgi:hypothetical protein